MNEITVQGMILETAPVGEYDVRVVLLTMDHGKLSAFARGARHQGNSLGAACRAFSTGNFVLSEHRDSYTIREARILNRFEDLQADLEKQLYGYYFLEFASFYTREGGDEVMVLRLLYSALQALIRGRMTPEQVRMTYEYKLMIINGDFDGIPAVMSDGGAAALSFITGTIPEKLFAFRLSEEREKELDAYLENQKRIYIHREFSSLRILSDMKAWQRPAKET